MEPLISVIIPIYNAEKYLDRCLKSILNQNYTTLEIVLVNDGSTDTSTVICEQFKREFPSIIQVINQSNSGASIARKNGVNAAKGDYLVFLDSDDYVSPNYVSALYDAICVTGAMISICPIKSIPMDSLWKFETPAYPVILSQEEVFNRFYRYEFWGYVGGCYPRRIFAEQILYPTATISEDYYVKTQIFSQQEFVAYVDTPLYCYEHHSGSLSSLPLSIRALGEIDNTIASWEYVKKHAPKYSKQALAIASEAGSKWLGRLKRNNDTQYNDYRSIIQSFIKDNFISIIANPFLLWKVKVVILRNLI